MTYSLAAAPAGMTISAAGLVTWNASAIGAYQVTVRVSDANGFTDQPYVLTVGNVLPLALTLAVTPQIVTAGNVVTITVATTGGAGPVTKSLLVDGANVALDANGQARVTAAGIGGHPVKATVTDGTDTLTQLSYYAIPDPADTTPPVALIATPANDSEIKTAVDIVGTASDAHLAQWTLSFGPANTGNFTQIATGSRRW
jgi:hypothetical protein